MTFTMNEKLLLASARRSLRSASEIVLNHSLLIDAQSLINAMDFSSQAARELAQLNGAVTARQQDEILQRGLKK